LTGQPPEERTYTGWKVGLVIVVVTFAVFSVLNLVAKAVRHHPDPSRPTPSVVTTGSP
jgi:antibiotic biosynthesis monooxygenase (ABM) superfamily enzyme